MRFKDERFENGISSILKSSLKVLGALIHTYIHTEARTEVICVGQKPCCHNLDQVKAYGSIKTHKLWLYINQEEGGGSDLYN